MSTDSELHDAVYIVGSLDELITLRGMNYHPIDIEMSVLRCHKKIAECATFTWTNLLVVVVELDGNESEALDLVPLVTNTVLEEHQLIVGVVVVVDPGKHFSFDKTCDTLSYKFLFSNRCRSNQFSRRETTNAFARWIPSGSIGSHLCRLQHVNQHHKTL